MLKKFLHLVIILGFIGFIGVISLMFSFKPSLEEYQNNTPKADFINFFSGKAKAHGIIQDWRGKVIKSFEIDMLGEFANNQGTLKEDFVYSDGTTQKRQWNIEYQDNQFSATAADIVGKAKGAQNGNAVNFNYTLQISMHGKTVNFDSDDWMYFMSDKLVINRNYLKKFGFKVAELTIVIEKQ